MSDKAKIYYLADALMGMVEQNFRDVGKGRITDNCLSSEEYAIRILVECGLAKRIYKRKEFYRLNYKKLNEMEKDFKQTN